MLASVRVTLAVVAASSMVAAEVHAEGSSAAVLAMSRDLAPVQPIALPPLSLHIYEAERKSLPAALAWELIPGAGSLYADDFRGAILTWALIAGGTAGVLLGISQFGPADPVNPEERKVGSPLAMPLLIGGLVVGTAGRVYGFVNAFRAAERYNTALIARLQYGSGASLSVTPFVTAGADAGLAVSGRF